MNREQFNEIIARGEPLAGDEMIAFMRAESDAVRRILFDLNGRYHTPDEVRALFAEAIGQPVDPGFRLFPPFYTDFGRNIHLGRNVFINACCQFQDQGGIFIGDDCLIGHSVVMATLNHGLRPAERQHLTHRPIRLGRGVWVGAHATILGGVTIGDDAVIAAGAVVNHDVAPRTVVGGVPARLIKHITD